MAVKTAVKEPPKEPKEEIVIEEFKDTLIECLDCKTKFDWSAGEQKYYSDMKLATPKRCASCRHKRKLAVNAGKVRIIDS